MTTAYPIDPREVKTQSESLIQKAGGKTLAWLPILEQSELRGLDDLIGRTLVMNALGNIFYRAPILTVKDWIEDNNLSKYLSASERKLLTKNNEELSEDELTNLYWYIEGLWALLWAGGLIPQLDFARPVDDTLASLVPNLKHNEGGDEFAQKMKLRLNSEIFAMLDLYYRLHWYAMEGRLNGYSTEPISLDVVMERRKALEWLMDSKSDWDHIDLST